MSGGDISTSAGRKAEIERKKEQLALLRLQSHPRSSADYKSNLIEAADTAQVEALVNSLIGPPLPGFRFDIENATTQGIGFEYPKAKAILSIKDVNIVELIPEEHLLYSKEIQTDFLDEFMVEDIQKAKEADSSQKISDGDLDSEIKIEREIIAEFKSKEMSDSEKFGILGSESFGIFFDKSSKLIERALNEDYDFLIDYNIQPQKAVEQSKKLKLAGSFKSERWTKNRSCTSLDWCHLLTRSPGFSELFLGSYSKSASNASDPNGLCLVWNMHLKDRPEFILESQSDLLVAQFSQFHPSLIVGGSYNGQMHVWDTRTSQLTPVQSSSFFSGHSHPVYAIEEVGTQNANTLVTASNDGTICYWQLDMLTQPLEKFLLTTSIESNRPSDVSITSLAFQSQDTTTFWVGTEQGNLYLVNRFDRAESQARIDPGVSYVGHHGLITGIEFSPSKNLDTNNLLLTSSIDWTAKLWKIDGRSGGACIGEPYIVFDGFEDYVTDVSWCPLGSSKFSTVDMSGTLHLFDYQRSETSIATAKSSSGSGFNKIEWAPNGKYVATGCFDGQIDVYDASRTSD